MKTFVSHGKRNLTRSVLAALMLPLLVFCPDREARGEEPERNPAIKVMSFNIRYGSANDGDNHWNQRNYLVLETIEHFGPDLLGAQEVQKFQADYLREHLEGYGFHGVGRNDGMSQGEYVPIFWRLDRFELLDSGHFWLSESPEIPGSVSWDSSMTRMLSWVALRDKRGSRMPFIFANTHFDHRGAQARLESARLVRKRADAIEAELPVIITGDFNAAVGSAPYEVLVNAKDLDSAPYIDSWKAIHPVSGPKEGTFSAWNGRRTGARIDWIVHSPKFVTLHAAINYTNEEGRYPSDHYPVQCVLRRR